MRRLRGTGSPPLSSFRREPPGRMKSLLSRGGLPSTMEEAGTR